MLNNEIISVLGDTYWIKCNKVAIEDGIIQGLLKTPCAGFWLKYKIIWTNNFVILQLKDEHIQLFNLMKKHLGDPRVKGYFIWPFFSQYIYIWCKDEKAPESELLSMLYITPNFLQRWFGWGYSLESYKNSE